MRDAIRRVLAGDVWTPADVDLAISPDQETDDLVRRMATLTPQQVRVLMMVQSGLLNKQIAWELKISEKTVKMHRALLLEQLGVAASADAIRIAVEAGL